MTTLAIADTGQLSGIILIALGAIGMYQALKHTRKLKRYGRMIDDIHVVEKPNGEEMDLGAVEEFCIQVKTGSVLEEAERQTALLKEAGNRTGAKVNTIMFQYGRHRLETPEEYRNRVINTVAENLSSAHERYATQNNGWYNRYYKGELDKSQ